jgi:hypothetical protein
MALYYPTRQRHHALVTVKVKVIVMVIVKVNVIVSSALTTLHLPEYLGCIFSQS